MRSKWIGISAVVAVAAGIIIYRRTSTPDVGHVAPAAAAATAAAPSTAAIGSVILVANLAEADEPCVCGKIIRSARAVGAKGIPVKEIDPEASPQLASSYKVLVSPAVLLLDGSGREVRRFEGESKDTLAALQTELERLPAKKP